MNQGVKLVKDGCSVFYNVFGMKSNRIASKQHAAIRGPVKDYTLKTKRRWYMVRYIGIKDHPFHSRKCIVQLDQLLLGKLQLVLRRDKVLPLFGYVWVFRDQPCTGFMCIG